MTRRSHPQAPPAAEAFSAQAAVIRRVTGIGVAVNLLLAAAKLAAGHYGQSQAVFADGIEALLDVFTVLMVYAGSRIWNRPADDTHPFGHGRLETLFAVGVGASLAAVGAGIGWQAVATLREPHAAAPGWIAAAAAGASIVGKESLFRWTLSAGKRIRSAAVIATAWHYRSDAFSSAPVVVAVTAAILVPSWTFIDHLGAAVVSVFILHAAFKVTWPNLRELIDAGAPEEIRRRIRDIAGRHPGVRQVHDIRTRFIGASIQLVLHIVVDGDIPVRAGHAIAKEVEARLLRDIEEVVDVEIHVDPPEGADRPAGPEGAPADLDGKGTAP
jgi:cation diffusion facilitator family transporter